MFKKRRRGVCMNVSRMHTYVSEPSCICTAVHVCTVVEGVHMHIQRPKNMYLLNKK